MSLCSPTSGVLGTIYPLLMAAILGIGDGVFNTQLNALLGILFKHDMVLIFLYIICIHDPVVYVIFVCVYNVLNDGCQIWTMAHICCYTCTYI